MLYKTKIFFSNAIRAVLFSCLMLANAQAAKPLWTFAPQTPTNITVAKGDSAQVTYTIHNQSSKTKTLIMKPIAGINQSTPCQLPAKGSCMLTLNVNGSALQGDVVGGPVLCQQSNALQCYQPSSTNILRIRVIQKPPIQQYTVTPSAGANGAISPATAQVANAGSSLTFTATPDAGFSVNQWLLDNNVVQTGGTSYQLSNLQANHTVEVTFAQATLSPLTQNLALSINAPLADPELPGNPRTIRIENTGSIPADNVQVSTTAFPAGTSMTTNTCTGTLNAGQTCDITITPGGTANPDNNTNACTTGTAPEPTVVTVSSDNAQSTDINVLVLGYGCIYEGGFLFAVDDLTPSTTSISGKVAAEEDLPGGTSVWGPNTPPVGGISDTSAPGIDSCDGKNDGACNTSRIIAASLTPPAVAAKACDDLNSNGFTDWVLPAACELGRGNFNPNANCGMTNPNLYSALVQNGNIGNFVLASGNYSSSTENSMNLQQVWFQVFNIPGGQFANFKTSTYLIRCIRSFNS